METEKKVFTFYDAVYNKCFQKDTEVVNFNSDLILKYDMLSPDEWYDLEKILWRHIILDSTDDQLKDMLNDKDIKEEDLEKEDFDTDELEDRLREEQENDILTGQMCLISAYDANVDFMVNSLNLPIFYSETFQQNILIVPLGPAYNGWANTCIEWYAIDDNDDVKFLQKTFNIEICKPTELQRKLLTVLDLPLRVEDNEDN